jgi:DNA end-binding protein Ku
MTERKIASMDITIGNFDIPIDLYKAVSDDKEDLKIITDCCSSPRKLKYLCSKCEKEVSSNYREFKQKALMSGGEVLKVIPSELLNSFAKTRSNINIESFNSEAEIGFQEQKTSLYYILPEADSKNKDRTARNIKKFSLLLTYLKINKQVAVAKVVIYTKELLVKIQPFGNVLTMNEIVYAEQIRDIPKDTPTTEIQAQEMELMKKLAERFRKQFVLQAYKNEYSEKLNQAINGEIEVAVKPKQEKKEVSLLDELEQA